MAGAGKVVVNPSDHGPGEEERIMLMRTGTGFNLNICATLLFVRWPESKLIRYEKNLRPRCCSAP